MLLRISLQNRLYASCLLVCILALSQGGCLAHLWQTSADTAKLTQRYAGKTLWLKYSLYAGQFYDNPRLGLLALRPFHTLDWVHNLDNEPIYPGPKEPPVPMGTAAIIEKIEWPTYYQQVRRQLISPKGVPWVYVRLARTRGHTSFFRDKLYILPAPGNITDEHEMARWLDGIFSKDDTNTWLLEQDPAVIAAITQKEPVLGMNVLQLLHAMGKPTGLSRKQESVEGKKTTYETAQYDDYTITLQNGKVVQKTPLGPLAQSSKKRFE